MYGLHNTLLLSLDMLADHLLCACKIPIFHTFIEGIVLSTRERRDFTSFKYSIR